MIELALGALAAFFAAIPAVLNILEGRRAERKGTRDALTKRSLDEFTAGVDGVLGHSPVQPK
jgi:hypothetical protein